MLLFELRKKQNENFYAYAFVYFKNSRSKVKYNFQKIFLPSTQIEKIKEQKTKIVYYTIIPVFQSYFVFENSFYNYS